MIDLPVVHVRYGVLIRDRLAGFKQVGVAFTSGVILARQCS
ncbi:hypothetical protein [Martelella alba]|nr:hypothetical protein [Martelella alba]